MMESAECLNSILKKFAENALKGINGKSAVDKIRNSAIRGFLAKGIPTTKHKDWKHTKLTWDSGLELRPDSQPDLGVLTVLETDSPLQNTTGNYWVTIFDCELQINLSRLPKHVSITKLKDLDDKQLAAVFNKMESKHDAFTELNTGLVKNGFLLKVTGRGCAEPICVNYINSSSNPSFNQMRNIFSVKKGAKLNIVEYFFAGYGRNSRAPQFNNTVAEWVIEKGAQVTKYSFGSMGDNDKKSKTVNSTFVNQQADSKCVFYSFYFYEGGVVRNNLNIQLADKGARCDVYSISLLSENAHIDNNIVVKHTGPQCTSSQIFKGVFNDSSKGVFDSCVLVEKGAQKTIARQKNNNILLSDYASINSNPQLEIFADDVECVHGSTAGQLDNNALFYLQSRGLTKILANNVLLIAFLRDVVEKITDSRVKTRVLLDINKKLGVGLN